MWLGRSTSPHGFASPASGEYALLLVLGDVDVSVGEQSSLSEQFVRSGCRYAVCLGPTGSSWDDSIDMACVAAAVDDQPSPLVMTTWHEGETLEEAVGFFAEHTRFDGWAADEFVVFVLGGPELEREVRAAVRKQFS